jgi:hypothetical protein
MGVLIITKPALENGIEFTDDRLQATASGASGLLSDLVPKCLAALRTDPTSTERESITQKLEPLSFVHAVTHAGFLRV